MKYSEKNISVFSVDESYHLAHCIASDCLLGDGIAVQFERIFNLKKKLELVPVVDKKSPGCVKIGRVYNLITKSISRGKPTYKSVRKSLGLMLDDMERNGIKKLAMPKIGTGCDKLNWEKVRDLILDIFIDTDVEILVCYL